MSAALQTPAFLVTPEVTHRTASDRAHPTITSGEALILARARAKLGSWRLLDLGARNRLLRSLGIALAKECGGLSLSQLASAADVSEALVRKTLKLFEPDNAQAEATPQG